MRPGPALLSRAGARAAFARPLPPAGYARPAAEVAVDLLGRTIVRRTPTGFRAARIVETEAYVRGDRASHAYLGPTPRNLAMFATPGTLYVYRIHQVHCLNAVTVTGEAVLLRAAEPGAGVVGSTVGPGRLARALGVSREENGSSLVTGPVRISSVRPAGVRVVRGPRVGIRWDARRRLRFAVDGSPWLSRPRIGRRPTTYRSFAQS